MSRRQLTRKQHAFLQFLREHVERYRVWPTYREIVDHFEYRSPNSVTQNLQALSRKGFLRRDRDGYSLVEVSPEDGSVSVRGRVRDGALEPAAERLALADLFPDADGLHAVQVDEETARPAELEGARWVLLTDGEGETAVVLGRGRLALVAVGPDGTIETDLEDPELLGAYAGHAGPYGVVRHRARVAEPA